MAGYRRTALALTAALTLGLSACSGGGGAPPGGPGEPPGDQQPAETTEPPPPPLTENSMPDSDTMDPGGATFDALPDTTDPAQMEKHPCQGGEWADTGIPTTDESSIRQRTYESYAQPDSGAQVVVLQYDDIAAAEAGYQTVAEWMENCPTDTYEQFEDTTPIEVGPEVQAQLSVWSSESDSQFPGKMNRTDLAVFQNKHRVVWVATDLDSVTDTNFESTTLNPTDESPHWYFDLVPYLAEVTSG